MSNSESVESTATARSRKYIQILNLVVPTTIEGRIFYRLYDRIGIFEKSIGDLEAILGDRDLERAALVAHAGRSSSARSRQRRRSKRADLIARAMVRRQKDHEVFDNESKRFLGTDDVFRQRFHDIEEGERYLHPTELRNFVARYASEVAPGWV